MEDYYPLPTNPDEKAGASGKAVNGRAAALRKKKKAAAAAAKSRKRQRLNEGDGELWDANGISPSDSLAGAHPAPTKRLASP